MTSTWIKISAIISLFILGGMLIYLQKTNLFEPSLVASPIPITTPNTQLSPAITTEANIQVSKPKANERLTLPITIEGQARVFENQLNYKILECEGRTLTEGFMTAQSPDMGQFGKFETVINSLPAPFGTTGCVEVFSLSPKDGSEINVVTFSILFDFSNATKVSVFFGRNDATDECTNVFPTARYVTKTQVPARAALEELLKGPVKFEKDKAYFTSINDGIIIQKLTIVDGIARVDFNKRLEESVGGSCRVAAIRAQITQTLKQFPSVKEVVISIDGRTEDILQP